MSEPKKPKGLPMFKPIASPKQTTVQRMPKSKSQSFQTVPPNIQRAKPAPRPNERPVRQYQRVMIDKKDIRTPRQAVEETYAQVRSFATDFSGDKDALVASSAAAVQLPLVPNGKPLPTAASILTPSDSDIEDKLMLVQLPSSLPITYPNGASQMDYNPLFMAADGQIGKIRIHKSGRVTAKIGNVTFDVRGGIAPSCLQMGLVTSEKELKYIPVPGNKIKLTVDVEKIQEDIALEQERKQNPTGANQS